MAGCVREALATNQCHTGLPTSQLDKISLARVTRYLSVLADRRIYPCGERVGSGAAMEMIMIQAGGKLHALFFAVLSYAPKESNL